MKKSNGKQMLITIGIIVAMVSSTVLLSAASGQGVEKTPTIPNVESTTALDEYSESTKDKAPEDFAVDFIKAIYSDYRTVTDDNEFEKIIKVATSSEDSNFKQFLRDKKYLKDQSLIFYAEKEYILKNKFDTPKIINRNENEIILTVKGNHAYRSEYTNTPNSKSAVDNEGTSGGNVAFYAVWLKKEGTMWKVCNITSNDTIFGCMFPGADFDSDQKTIDRLKESRNYDVNKAISILKEAGEQSIKSRGEVVVSEY